MRRLRALAALDPEVHAVITARDQRRSDGLEVIVNRALEYPRAPSRPDRGRAVRTLLALTSFETFDVLATNDQDLTDVVPEVVGLAQSALQEGRHPYRAKRSSSSG